ncbi:hypothetical protein BHE90_015326 [Fusarium euwallaceae]|uniref:Cytochrome b2, mitochondrial n=3 Tax=Fusarium solani species complex TaxID=232080 RepID=A0A3M2SJ61_9HYPO|nr:hypothetical protein CDV36_002719 [Fusarium kuroshium]RSL65352.1 hypothetical protein CEP51_013016 [Fusarium floridanum]RTE70282.1 hypothetical protein BHE90_015326 [Fusarium euwallaceae]
MTSVISASELSKHDMKHDIWISVNGKVYNMTEFAPEHPGGAEIIYQHGGADASTAYNEAHGPSLIGKSLDVKFHVGTLDPATVPPQVPSNPQAKDRRDKPDLDDIINLDDFEHAATKSLSQKAIAYISSGSNDNDTRDANRSVLRKILLRPRVMRNVRDVKAAATLFGCELDIPVFISPTGAARTGGAEGELTLARGAAAGGIVHCFATPSSYPYDEILDETPRCAFFQLYVSKDRRKSEVVIRQMDASGKIKAILVTVDVPVVPKREADERIRSNETLSIAGVKVDVKGGDKKGAGLARQSSSFIDSSVDWGIISWLRGLTSLPIVVKGIQTAHDARMAHQYGCDGIVISNHGGRAVDHAPPAILILLELQKNCPEVLESMEVLIDGGFRRGADVVKAICLGASAIGIGRSFLYSLSYGQQGVEHAISILRDEIETTMRLCGMTDLMRDAHPDLINTLEVDHLVPTDRHPYATRIGRRQSRL